MTTKYLAYMLPDELSAYLNSGNAIAICGCGSVEQHGPHQLLGTDTYFTTIFMDYTAQECDGLVVPIMPFSWIGGLRQWAGTIDIRSRCQVAYLESMCLDLVDIGFRRIVLMNGHGGGREMTFSAARRVFRKTGVPVFAIYASNYWSSIPDAKQAWLDFGVTDSAAFEPSMAAAGMVHMGRPDLADALLANAKEMLDHGGDYAETTMPFTFRQAQSLGSVSHSYWEERRHSRPSYQINPAAGQAVARAAAKALAAQIQEYAAYTDRFV